MMKKFLKIFAWIVITPLLLLCIYILASGKTYLVKALTYNFVDIDDNILFYQRKIKAGEGIEWPQHHEYNKRKVPPYLNAELEKWKSVAFLIIKQDSVLYEKYWEGYSAKSISNSFSMAKSIVGVLTGIALSEGKIKNIDDAVAEYLPEFQEENKSRITIRHLLMMSSGLDWDEAYANPLSVTTEAYYGDDLKSLVLRQNVLQEPGKEFIYQSGNTELLALILEKATGMSLSEYTSEKLWKPLHAVRNAEWSLDRNNGHEKAYCCFYSNARDFARIGSLYLHNGEMFGKQIVPKEYVQMSVIPGQLTDRGNPNTSYGLHWWITSYNGHKIFYMRGILGQYVVVIPDQQIVFVRLGHLRADKDANGELTDLPVYIRGVLEMAGN
jgi:CubicO group peptidase (beta-lactamase class C family)